MITEIQGDTNTFRAMAYGRPDILTIEWCRQNEANHLAKLDPSVRAQYLAMEGTVFGAIDYMGIANMARALRNKEDTIWLVNDIIDLTTLAELRNPPPVMIDWIMANPVVREAYQEQRIAGYDEYYIDTDPNDIGESHYHYRRVMDGIMVETPDGGMVATEWFDDIRSPTDNLLFSDQLKIINVWDTMTAILQDGVNDPTSRFNATL